MSLKGIFFKKEYDCDEDIWLAKVGHFLGPLSVEYPTVAITSLLELWTTAITREDSDITSSDGSQDNPNKEVIHREEASEHMSDDDDSCILQSDQINEIDSDSEQLITTRSEEMPGEPFTKSCSHFLKMNFLHILSAALVSLLYLVPRFNDIHIRNDIFQTIFYNVAMILYVAPTTLFYIVILSKLKKTCEATMSDLSLRANDYLLLITGSCNFLLAMMQFLAGFSVFVMASIHDENLNMSSTNANNTMTKVEMYVYSFDALLPSVAFWIWVSLHMKFMMVMQRHLPKDKSSYKLLQNCLIHVIITNAFEWLNLGMVVEDEQSFYGAYAVERVFGKDYQVFLCLLIPPIALFRFHSIVTAYELWKHISANKTDKEHLRDGDKEEGFIQSGRRRAI